MYSYINLGKNGELGNQMFQYAALYSLGKKTGKKCVIPSCLVSTEDTIRPGGREPVTEIELYQAFKSLGLLKVHPEKILEDLKFSFVIDESRMFVYNAAVHNVQPFTNINGYFQSPLYFNEYKDEIKEQFSFDQERVMHISEKISNLRKQHGIDKICAVHLRRSDYSEKSDYHTNLGWEDYYLPAIRAIANRIPNITFLVFSDDIQWCKNNLPEIFLFSDCENQYDDMCMMSMCDAHIIANSSFSWWGSYLADKEHVIAPYRWFTGRGPDNWSTIYCDHWIVI